MAGGARAYGPDRRRHAADGGDVFAFAHVAATAHACAWRFDCRLLHFFWPTLSPLGRDDRLYGSDRPRERPHSRSSKFDQNRVRDVHDRVGRLYRARRSARPALIAARFGHWTNSEMVDAAVALARRMRRGCWHRLGLQRTDRRIAFRCGDRARFARDGHFRPARLRLRHRHADGACVRRRGSAVRHPGIQIERELGNRALPAVGVKRGNDSAVFSAPARPERRSVSPNPRCRFMRA